MAAAWNPNGLVRVEDALGFLFLGGKLLPGRRPPRATTPNSEALEHFLDATGGGGENGYGLNLDDPRRNLARQTDDGDHLVGPRRDDTALSRRLVQIHLEPAAAWARYVADPVPHAPQSFPLVRGLPTSRSFPKQARLKRMTQANRPRRFYPLKVVFHGGKLSYEGSPVPSPRFPLFATVRR
jgi:hypothetical protein